MYRLGSEEKPWFCDYSFNMSVDFCIWILELDGLRVPPFDHHPPGNGILQAAGLDADGWRLWLREVVNLQHQQVQAYRQPFMKLANEWWQSVQEKGGLPQDVQSETFRQHAEAFKERVTAFQQTRPDVFSPTTLAYNPPAVWAGNPAVGTRLAELWEQYKPISNKRREWERDLGRRWSQARGDGTSKQVWDDLEPYRTRLDSLFIHFVAYPQPVDYLVPPVSALLAVANGQLDGPTFRTRLLHAAEELATSSPS